MSTIMNTVRRVDENKKGDDFFETQNETIDHLISNYFFKDYDLGFGDSETFVDFNCGNFAILNRFKERFPLCEVQGYDIVKRCDEAIELDMFESEEIIKQLPEGSNIVLNPPFNLLTKTLEYFLKMKNKYPDKISTISILMRFASMEGITRYKIYREYGSASIIINMVKRQKFNTYFEESKNIWQPPFSTCWLIWDCNSSIQGESVMRWVYE